MLQASSPSKHNVMLGQKVRHPKSTNFDDHDEYERRSVKRQKRSPSPEDEKLLGSTSISRAASPDKDARVIPDSDADSDSEDLDNSVASKRTDLETALPPIKTDKEAIQEYEATRAAQEADVGLEGRLSQRKWIRGKSSIYVDAFNLALETVLEDESHLFNEAETAVFTHWRELSYEAQYLYVRLFLRKTAAWHRINRLGYHSDIADLDKAIEDLQAPRDLPSVTNEVLVNPGELNAPEGTLLGQSYTFADQSAEHITTLEEASSLLRLDELKGLAKDARVQGKNKRELLKALRRSSGKQAGLGFGGLKRSDTDASTVSVKSEWTEDEDREGTPQRLENRDAHFVNKIMAETGPCIRLSLPVLKLFERVHLVFYRSTEWTEKSLTTIILARIARWNFPDYIVSRSANIFPSRSLLLEFEAAVRTQYRVDNILEFNGTPTKDNLETILDIFEEVYPRWKTLLQEEQRKEDSIYETGEGAYLRRLSPAWVYTRIIHKGAYVLGKFKHHKREHEVLTDLLVQRLFHTSRRGDWYQRKALLEEHYMHALTPSEGRNEETQKKHWKRISLQTCEEGLEDRLVHIIYHYDLQKRVVKLEKSLKVPKRQQHEFTHVRLAKPVERTFYGIRIERPDRTSEGSRRPSTPGSGSRRGAKTIWLDPGEDEGNGECSVEAMCLSNYRTLGYRGYHSEGGILRTLFAYLFLDILFVYIPNVFQTPYQTCPLDLHTDAFYPSRISEINQRLNDISNGEAGILIQRVWDEHHERKTCVVGLDWSFELSDLLEIAQCFPPAALSTICKAQAQEYAQRGGGVPDLFLWKLNEDGTGEVMFSEVKSENDRLSDTQRLWIDVISGAGVRVELCNALASEVRVVEK
ncbi:hypothetical protein M8818_000759 [Zalaria obscura]|uniref:Uncharacterized protein n=1 Tax=Zalaria obscura TaxID=2024903 RepID=A0ACC3SP80_9PEZI